VYTGLHQTPEQIVQAVIQEDADALGSRCFPARISSSSSCHRSLEVRGTRGRAVVGRWDYPDDDIAGLEALGVARVFTPGASLAEIGTWLESTLDAREHLH